MNTNKSILICVLAATTALAEKPHIEIEARYEGFPSSLFSEVHRNQKKDPPIGAISALRVSQIDAIIAGAALPDGVLSAPRVTTKAGQTAVIEIIREVQVPPSTAGKKVTNCGVMLEVSPDFKDGQITLSGKSTVRHQLQPGEKQPLDAVSFTARETFFSGTIANGKSLTIRVGDGPKDKSRVTLTAKLIEPASPQPK